MMAMGSFAVIAGYTFCSVEDLNLLPGVFIRPEHTFFGGRRLGAVFNNSRAGREIDGFCQPS